MSVRLRNPVACLVLLSLTGCNVAIAGALTQPPEVAPAGASEKAARPTVFNLAPDGALPKVSAAARAAAVWPAEGIPAVSLALPGVQPAPTADAAAAGSTEHVVRLVGRAHVNPSSRGIANVRDGLVTGSPVIVVDAQTGKTLARAVSFWDGSFSTSVRFRTASSAVLLSTELIDSADPSLKATISAPVYLRAADGERNVSITPGSTALTSFLQAVATMQDTGDAEHAQAALPADPSKLAEVTGPRLTSLIVAMKDDEDASYARLAAATPELAGAASVADLRAAIMKFVGRLKVKKAAE